MRTEEEYQKLYQQKYSLGQQYKKEVIESHEREEQNKKTRWDLLMEIKRLEDALDSQSHELRRILEKCG